MAPPQAAMSRWLRRSTTSAVVWMTAALVACGGSGSPSQDLTQAGDLTPFQREILEDGTVSADEYERAVLATLQCLDDEGVPRSQPERAGAGPTLRWRYSVGPYPDEAKGAMETAYDECFKAYERAILEAWVLQTAPSEKELESMRDEVLRCLTDRGLEFSNYDALNAARSTLGASDRELVTRCELLIFRGIDEFGEETEP